MNTNFKTALFGGFDREDVVSYIQQTSRENQQRVSALEEENHGLQERNRAMEAELNTLRRAVLENSAGSSRSRPRSSRRKRSTSVPRRRSISP